MDHPLESLEVKTLNNIKVALDFDDTVTLNYNLFNRVVSAFKSGGCDVRVVTFRFSYGDNSDVQSFAEFHGIPIIFTGGRQKSHVCEELGWSPDIWIDDSPHLIVSYKNLVGMASGCDANGDYGPNKAPVAVS